MAIIGTNLKRQKSAYETEEQMGDVFIFALKQLGYEIWCEVEARGGIIDVVAKKDNIYYTYHLKKQLSNKVLEQAFNCHLYNTVDYVVVPYLRNRSIGFVQSTFADKFNIGIIGLFNLQIDKEEMVGKIYDHDYYDIIKYRNENKEKRVLHDVSEILYDSQKTEKAGIKGGGYDTAFKRSLRKIIKYHTDNEYISMANTWEKLESELHWCSKNSMYSALGNLAHLDLVAEARSLMMDKNK